MQNKESDPEFESFAKTEIERIVPNLTAEMIASDPVLHGFGDLHKAIGVSSRKNISAPENLLLMLLKTGDLPHVNLLVDIYNLVSVKTWLALGAHDVEKIEGNVHLRTMNGDENFWPIGSPEPKRVKAGEYAYMDDANDVICRLEVRQVEKTKATVDTHNCFFIIQGNAAADRDCISSAARELIGLTRHFCGGEAEVLYTEPGSHCGGRPAAERFS